MREVAGSKPAAPIRFQSGSRFRTAVVERPSAAVLLSAGTAAAGPEDPSLSSNEAWLYSYDALKKEFHGGFVHGDGLEMHCGKRLARNLVRCKPSWFIGDVVYFGRLEVAHQRRKQPGAFKPSWTARSSYSTSSAPSISRTTSA